MRINHNLTAINTHRQMGISELDGSKSMEKLSSGFRINRAGDDAAGLAISEKMRCQGPYYGFQKFLRHHIINTNRRGRSGGNAFHPAEDA
jgi:hypothetical protein